MWKPGTSPPAMGKNSNKKKKNTKNEESSPLLGSGSILTTTSSSKATTPKRLSGATMNMRFMKRKQETQEQENERKRVALERVQASAVASETTVTIRSPPPSTVPLASERGFDDDGDDDDMDTDDDPTTTTTKTKTEAYQVATPIDMYGMQAALLGRRSFGGFNLVIAEAWKESKASLEVDASLDRPKKQKETDEELIQRYQDVVNKRSESLRAVGNLRDKGKPKRQRR